MYCHQKRTNSPQVVRSVPASQPCYGSGLWKHIDETKRNGQTGDARADGAGILVGQSHLLADNGSQIAVEGQHERLELPGARPRHHHFADRAIHDVTERAWLKAFLDGWLTRMPMPMMAQAAE